MEGWPNWVAPIWSKFVSFCFSMNFPHRCWRSGMEEVEVAAFVGLCNVVEVERRDAEFILAANPGLERLTLVARKLVSQSLF